MGIQGLLKNVRTCMREKNLEEYRGLKAAVDTYAWLHKIIKGPSGKEIITGKDPTKYVMDCIRRVEKINKAGVKLIMVFDGTAHPRKANEEEARRKRREQNFQKGKQLIESGQTELGLKKMIDSIDVSPDIAYKLIEELESRNIEFIVAPYEADAQLAYLSRTGIVDIIITEDSDLLAFGAKRVLYKLDFSTLNGEQVQLQNIKNEPTPGFNWFSHNMFLTTCIMAGCDYLPQIKGVGMKMAQKLISKNHTIKKALAQLSSSKQIPEGYEQNFMKALLTFRFQRVYCPKRRACVTVNQMDPKKWRDPQNMDELISPQGKLWVEEVLDAAMLEFALKLSADETHSDWQFLGKKLTNEMAQKVGEGKINPITFKQYDQNCLSKLRYNKVINLPSKMISKKSHTHSAPGGKTQNTLMGYIKPLERLNVLEYRSKKNRQINEEQYTVIQKEDSLSNQHLLIRNFYHKQVKKKALKLNDNDSSSSEEEEVITINEKESKSSDKAESIDLISSEGQNKVQEVQEVEQVRSERVVVFKNRLEEISQTFFGQIFSEEFLRSPFG